MSEIWDATKLASYACERRGHYAMERHLRSNEPSEALAFGIAFHKAVEVWTKASIDDVTSAMTNGTCHRNPIEEGKAAFVEAWAANLPQDLQDKLELEGNRRSIANGYRLFEAFTRKFPIEMFDKIVATETPFTLYLGRTPSGHEVSWSGILDRAVIWQGGLYYVDIKTSSFPLDDRFFSQFRLSGQLYGYAWAGQELQLGEFTGVMIQAVEVKAPAKTARGRTVEELLGVDIIPLLPEHIEEWKTDTLRKIDLIYEARERQSWTRNRGEICNSYTGCPFRRVCLAHPDLREDIIKENYVEEEWNPLDRD